MSSTIDTSSACGWFFDALLRKAGVVLPDQELEGPPNRAPPPPPPEPATMAPGIVVKDQPTLPMPDEIPRPKRPALTSMLQAGFTFPNLGTDDRFLRMVIPAGWRMENRSPSGAFQRWYFCKGKMAYGRVAGGWRNRDQHDLSVKWYPQPQELEKLATQQNKPIVYK